MRLPVLLLVFGFEAHGHEQTEENGCADPGRTGLKAAGERTEHARTMPTATVKKTVISENTTVQTKMARNGF